MGNQRAVRVRLGASARAFQGRLLKIIDESASPAEENDVSAAAVVDRGKLALAQRLSVSERSVSWLAVAGLFLLAIATVWMALWLGKCLNG